MGINSALGSSALLPAGLGFRNIFINGNMQIAQRGTSFGGITASGYYTCDRWHMNLSVGGTWTQTQSTDAPPGFSNSLRVQCTTANNSLATTNNVRIWQKIEGFNVQQLAKGTAEAKPIVLTFWVKAFQTGTFVCTLDDLTNSRKISASYTINASGTWEKKTLYFSGDITGAFPNDTSATLMPTWWIAAGPSWQGSALSTSWSSSSTLSNYANGQTNVSSSTSNYFQITGVQLEQNYQPTPFEQRPYGTELALCQRYFYKAVFTVGSAAFATGYWASAFLFYWSAAFPVTMRRRPDLAQSNMMVDSAVGGGAIGAMTTKTTAYTFGAYAGTAVSGTAGQGAILQSIDTTSYIQADAEL